ncbi:MAG: PAS domain S-box protein [Gemmatimonadota bacterium]
MKRGLPPLLPLGEQLLEELLGALISTRPDGEIVAWNSEASDLFGFTAEEAIGQSVFDTIVPSESEEERRKWTEAAAAPGPTIYEGVRRRKDGLFMYVDVVAKAINDRAGSRYLISNERDTTPIRYQREAKILQTRFGGVIEAAPDAIVLVDRGGRISLVNPEVERLLGYGREELLGKPVDLLVPDRFRDTHSAHRSGYFADPRTRAMGIGLQLSALKKDGTECPVEISLSPLEVGNEVFAIASIRDVTERRRTEARFRALLESAPDAMVIVDRSGRIALVNSQLEQLFGYTRDELIEKPVDALVPTRFRGVHPGHRTGYLSDPHARPMGTGLDLWARRKDGSEFPVEISLSPVETEEGTLVTASIRNVSERKLSEERRRKNTESRFRRESEARREVQEYLDAMSTLNAKVAWDGTILLVNRIAQEASGLSLDALLETAFADAPWWSWDDDLRTRMAEAFEEALSGTTVTGEENFRIFDVQVPVSFSLVPIAGADGKVAYIVMEARDISRLVAAEHALRTANEELEAFTYSVSHDLRAPLRQVDGFSKVLREHLGDDVDPKTDHLMQRIENGTRHMGQLVDDLLYLARVGRQDLRVRPTPLESVVQETIGDLKADAKDRKIEWRVGELPVADCDPGLVRIVFTNLLSNAVKYSRPREVAVIEVGSCKRQGTQAFFVRDNGVGFDAKYADKLFGVFQRLHRADQFEGSGVGLATVRRIVHKHGGEIWAQAEKSIGATFTFTLGPAGKADPAESR